MKLSLPAAAVLIGICCFAGRVAVGQNTGNFTNQTPLPGQSLANSIPLAGQPAPGGLLGGKPQEGTIVEQSSAVLKELMDLPAQRIPISLLKNAEAVAIIPNMITGGFIVGGKQGYGVILVRDNKGSWHAPSFINLTGGSVGLQAGIQSTDLVLVFKTRKSVDGLLQGKVTLGTNASVAAGPVGREALAATDLRMRAEIYSYSRSRGAFVGVSLDGSVMRIDEAADAGYYGVTANGQVQQVPAPAIKLIEQVINYTSEPDELTNVPAQNPTNLSNTGGFTPSNNTNYTQPNLNNQNYGTSPGVGTLPAQQASSSVAVRQELAAQWPRLAPLLDARWQAYLAMPREIFAAQTDPSMDTLATVISHYDTVAADPRYRLLTEKQVFQSTHQLLHEYYKVLQSVGRLNSQFDFNNMPKR